MHISGHLLLDKVTYNVSNTDSDSLPRRSRMAILEHVQVAKFKIFQGLCPWTPLGGLTAPPQTPQLLDDGAARRRLRRFAPFFKTSVFSTTTQIFL